MLPNYMQVWGIARNHGIRVRECHLSEDQGWAPDLAGPCSPGGGAMNGSKPTGTMSRQWGSMWR